MNGHGGARSGSGRKPVIPANRLLDLRENQRLSFREIADRYGMNKSSVANRYRRLKQQCTS